MIIFYSIVTRLIPSLAEIKEYSMHTTGGMTCEGLKTFALLSAPDGSILDYVLIVSCNPKRIFGRCLALYIHWEKFATQQNFV